MKFSIVLVVTGESTSTKLHLDLGDNYGLIGKASVCWVYCQGLNPQPQSSHGYLLLKINLSVSKFEALQGWAAVKISSERCHTSPGESGISPQWDTPCYPKWYCRSGFLRPMVKHFIHCTTDIWSPPVNNFSFILFIFLYFLFSSLSFRPILCILVLLFSGGKSLPFHPFSFIFTCCKNPSSPLASSLLASLPAFLPASLPASLSASLTAITVRASHSKRHQTSGIISAHR